MVTYSALNCGSMNMLSKVRLIKVEQIGLARPCQNTVADTIFALYPLVAW